MELGMIVCIDKIHADGAVKEFIDRDIDCALFDDRRVLFDFVAGREWFGEFLQKHIAFTDFYQNGESTLTQEHWKVWSERK